MSHEEIALRFVIELFLVIAAIALIPVVAIVAPLTIKMILSHSERKAKIRAEENTKVKGTLRDELEALRLEVSRLRDTTTQYDISIQHTLEELHQRLARVEGIVRPQVGATIDEPVEQPAQLRRL